MYEDRTRTDDEIPTPGEADERLPTLVVVHHRDPAQVGVQRVFFARERAELGRGSRALGTGVLDDDLLSRHHCRVASTDAGLRITDLDSRNGVFVDGRRVGDAVLVPGSVVRIGSLLLVVAMRPSGWRPAPDPGGVVASVPMDAVFRAAQRIAADEAPVLVTGETGTGKELVARSLHRESGRTGPFLAINCGGVDDAVLRSELFGHTRGAFTGADRARRGLIEEASDGTLLLDEIGEASPALQASLLRVLQEREVRTIGSNHPVSVQTRFVAATHRDLLDGVETGAFREDLYARLAAWTLAVPPLRQRRADILPIAHATAEARAGRPLRLSRALAERLLLLPWPRNVRELVTTVQRLVVASDGDVLDVDPTLLPSVTPPAPAPRPTGERPTSEALRAALVEHAFNVSACAGSLGVSRVTLYRWLRTHGIDVAALREQGDTPS